VACLLISDKKQAAGGILWVAALLLREFEFRRWHRLSLDIGIILA
jgi:hypothetical protein